MNENKRSCTSQNSEWQSIKEVVKDRLAHIFNNEMFSDVHFVVGKEGKVRIPAHKLILSVGSSVFCAMFHGALAEKTDEVAIPDIEPPAFLNLLRFLYSDDVSIISAGTVMQTLYAAKKYAVPALQVECSKFLLENLSQENAFELLIQALLFDDTNLEKECLRIIDRDSNSFSRGHFCRIDSTTLSKIIDRDSLQLKEIDIFRHVLRWSTYECQRTKLPVTIANQRAVLGNVLKLIRYPLMTIDEFSDVVAESGLLTDRDVSLVVRYLSASRKPKLEFISSPRTPLEYVKRFKQVETVKGSSRNDTYCMRFNVSCEISVLGFGLYGVVDGSSMSYDVIIELYELPSYPYRNSMKNLLGSSKKTRINDPKLIFEVRFQTEIPLSPGRNYSAYVTYEFQDPNRSKYSGKDGQRTVTVKSSRGRSITFTFENYSDDNLKTTVVHGQIPEIIFRIK